MPTGYTAPLQDKPDMPLRDFVLQCARAFGACIMQRDDPLDAPIQLDEPDDYHRKAEAEAAEKLYDMERWTAAKIREAHSMALAEARKRRDEAARERSQIRASYERMLRLVREWEPPTPEHAGLKDFMVKQLTESIEWDCSTDYYDREAEGLAALAVAEWHRKELVKLRDNIAYHRKNLAEEIERTNKRNEWKRQLFESLT